MEGKDIRRNQSARLTVLGGRAPSHGTSAVTHQDEAGAPKIFVHRDQAIVLGEAAEAGADKHGGGAQDGEALDAGEGRLVVDEDAACQQPQVRHEDRIEGAHLRGGSDGARAGVAHERVRAVPLCAALVFSSTR